MYGRRSFLQVMASTIRVGVLAAISALVTLLVLETTTRLIHAAPAVIPIQPGEVKSAYQLSSNPILGYELKANYRDPDPDFHESLPETNSSGQRDIERSVRKRPGTARVIVLGDSVVAGHGMKDLNDSISRQMERMVNDPRFEALNFGVGGYCTRGEVELLRTKGLAYSPDHVVVVFVENDYADSNSQAGNYYPRPVVLNRLFAGSALFRLVCLRFDLFQFRDQYDPVHAKRFGQHHNSIGSRNVRTGLSLLKQLADQFRFSVTIVLWPRFTDQDIVYCHEHRSCVSDSDTLPVERVAYRMGLPIYRLSFFFQEDYRRQLMNPYAGKRPTPRTLYTIGDEMHPSPNGARIAAEVILSLLQQKGSRQPWARPSAAPTQRVAPAPPKG